MRSRFISVSIFQTLQTRTNNFLKMQKSSFLCIKPGVHILAKIFQTLA